MSNTGVFKFFQPKGPKEDPIEKRRGQLRRAQHTYRARKDKYTRSLEAAFVRAQAHEELLMDQCARLRTTVDALCEVLTQNGIQPPADLCYDEGRNDPDHMWVDTPAASSSSTPKGISIASRRNYNFSKPRNLVEQSQVSSKELPAIPLAIEQRGEFPARYQHSTGGLLSPESNADAYGTPTSPEDNVVHVCDLDQVTVGMEFVLTIEEPCRDHIHGDINKPDEPNGHAMTATAQLMPTNRSLYSQTSSSPSMQRSSAAILDRLRNLSPLLCSDGETTPIQAWDLLRRKPQYSGLQLHDLRLLAERLRDTIKCHGYGAVINVAELAIFENML
ncbi:hypothetical protein BJ170DRAFT_72585 [Xylariales sp. AK1849]|nr:hypothetical protein BJ170DRAFT_72585 [Xylariales sp. AK1849]